MLQCPLTHTHTYTHTHWCVRMLIAQLCLTLWDPMDCNHQVPLSKGFSRQEYWSWLAIPFSRGSLQLRAQTQLSCIAGRFFTIWATKEAQFFIVYKSAFFVVVIFTSLLCVFFFFLDSTKKWYYMVFVFLCFFSVWFISFSIMPYCLLGFPMFILNWHRSLQQGYPALAGLDAPKDREHWHLQFSSVHFSRSVVYDSLWPHEPQHARPPCPSQAPRVYSNSCPSSRWCHPAISSSVVPFSSYPQSFQHQGLF